MNQFNCKIYIEDRVVVLCTHDYYAIKGDAGLFYKVDEGESIKDITQLFIANKNVKQCFVCGNNLDDLYNSFISDYKIIEAAGGVVLNQDKEILWINRLGKWDLPKGKIEKNEETPVAAIREVEEETGIRGLLISKPLQSTYHVYELKGKQILKITHWFEMKCNSANQKLTPQTEENITEVSWKKPGEMSSVLSDTYKTISDLIDNHYNF